MSYESFRPVKLFQWVNNQTRLNQTNMNELKNAVQSASDALLDSNGSGIIYDIGELNTGVFGNEARFEVGAERKIEALNKYIFGNTYAEYTTAQGGKKLVVPEVVQDYLGTVFGDEDDQEKCSIEGYTDWDIDDINLNGVNPDEQLTGHTGALAHLAHVKAQSKVNKLHLEAIDEVYKPNQITFKNSSSIIRSIHNGSDFLEINGASGVSVRFNQSSDDSIKITPEGIVHTIKSALPSIGTSTSRFGTLYVSSIDCSDGIDVGGSSSFDKLSTFNNGVKVTAGGMNVSGSTTLDGTLEVKNAATFQNKVTIESNGLEVSGSTNLEDTLTVTGESTLSKLSTTGTSTFGDKVTIQKNGLEVTGALTVTGESLITTPNKLSKLDVGNTTESEVAIGAAGKIILEDHVEFHADIVQAQNIQGSAPNSVVIKSTLDTAVANLTGESDNTIIDKDGSIDEDSALTLYGLRNAIKHYAVTWQSM